MGGVGVNICDFLCVIVTFTAWSFNRRLKSCGAYMSGSFLKKFRLELWKGLTFMKFQARFLNLDFSHAEKVIIRQTREK